MKEPVKKTLRTVVPVMLGAFVLYWIYRDFDFRQAGDMLLHQVGWGWMAASLLFGVLSHVFRGLRWKQTLEPLGERPRTLNCIDAIFVSYAANLVLPRVGELARCVVLKKYDDVSFPKSVGTVVTERLIDCLCMLLLCAAAFFLQMPMFMRFFHETGTKIPSFSHLIHSPWFYVSAFCVLGAIGVVVFLLRTFPIGQKVSEVARNIWQGILSVRSVRNLPLFVLYTLLIWLSYFLHFYLTFYCFSFTYDLGALAGLVMFVAGTIAVIVPTPNGAGPWHFAVITMMMLYGIGYEDAASFALIVHAIQTLLVIVLGVWGWLRLQVGNKE